jgi:7-cyano-7-deazaguanine synthase
MSILLISGGLDSAVATAVALSERPNEQHIPLSFFYGQRHAIERQYAHLLCSHFSLPLPRNINLAQPFAVVGGSSLTSGLVHGNPSTEKVERTEDDLPPSFVPGRNLIFLSLAAAVGYVEKQYTIVGGWNAVDYSGYPDCRNEFFQSLEASIFFALGLKEGSRFAIERPLIDLSKEEIIRLGLSLKVPFQYTYSCYSGAAAPCGDCDSCRIRAEGFAKVGIPDPALTAVG